MYQAVVRRDRTRRCGVLPPREPQHSQRACRKLTFLMGDWQFGHRLNYTSLFCGLAAAFA